MSRLFSCISSLVLALACLLPAGALQAQARQTEALVDRRLGRDIVASFAEVKPESFAGFLLALERGDPALPAELRSALAAMRAGDALSESQRNAYCRLLGIYARLRYGAEAMELLGELVAIPSFRVEGLPQHENPEFRRLGEAIAAAAETFGLRFRNVDDRVFEISIPGTAGELVGIHAHGDVVPVNPELWVLEDGTRLDPFRMTRIGDRLYGRGTEDDKNGIVASLYAMRVIREEGLPLLREFRLLIDTTEETSSEAIPYYFERNPVPEYNLALDGAYPVIIAEKGYGSVNATFPRRRASGEGAEVLGVSGGVAGNQIPARSSARLAYSDTEELLRLLRREARDYVSGHGDDFSIVANPAGDGVVLLEVIGVSAHSSAPQSGVNPVSRMFDFLATLDAKGLLRRNHISDAALYAAQNWGLDYHGDRLGIAFEHEFMGPLTAALTYVGMDEQSFRVTVNLRVPVGKTLEQLRGEIETGLERWTALSGVNADFDYAFAEPMYRNPEGLWVNALLDVATGNLDLPREFGSSSGGTSVHNLPNGVQFGLALPGEKYTGHNANEFKRVDQFLLDLQIVTEMMGRIGTMPAL